MGCMQSSQRHASTSAPVTEQVLDTAGANTSTSRLAAPTSSISRPNTGTSTSAATSGSAPHRGRAANDANAPFALKLAPERARIPLPPPRTPSDAATRRTISRKTLMREREAFFDTRVSGRPEVWAAVRMACELLEAGDAEEAKAVLLAAGCHCPTGEMWGTERYRGQRPPRHTMGGVFDKWGERYVVPSWCVGVPVLVVDGPDVEEESDDDDGEKAVELLADAGKGKARVADAPLVRVVARMSHTARDVAVQVRGDIRVKDLIEKLKEGADLRQNSRMKLVYMGRILHEGLQLSAQGWQEGNVVNALVLDAA
ncbi:hypothetical protein EJ06DRAFT_383807 [Trichodelitschia bisporula]|uniref:Ubiquitin-like domain-containing protein n=1 Tax=Trichodelitschia bisporula TaxID=703511 RepID=A0A6G1HZ80_9PEZI|nr:hypothetical protein EJ06DRAFT_383807 [Trichodelitschia bisporula]